MPYNILIIEDDIFLGESLVTALRAGGFEVRFTRNGASGFKELMRKVPDLVLLDSDIPGLSGYEVLKQKRADPKVSSIPVIVISSGDPEELNWARSLGATDYLLKSKWSTEEAMQKIQKTLHRGEGVAVVKGKGDSRSEQSGKLKGRRIMWVEDDEFLSDIIARKLFAQGCSLLNASDGEAAMRLLQKEKPDLILLDILLPGIDGYEILKRLKANSGTRDIPVVLLSNLGQAEDIEKGKKLGAARFLVKATVTLDEIVSEMKQVLAESGTSA